MGIIRKLFKEKTTDGIFENIKYETLRKISCILVILFMVNQAIEFVPLLYLDISIYKYLHEYNKYALFLGTLVLSVMLKKMADGKRLGNVRDLLKNNIPAVVLMCFGVLILITTILNGMPRIAIYGSYYRGEGLIGYLSYLIYFLLAAFVLTPRQKEKAVYFFAISSFCVAISVVTDYFLIGEKQVYKLILSRYNANHVGYYMLVSIMNFGMLFVTRNKFVQKFFSLLGFVMMLFALIINNTWGCQLALLVGIIFIIIVYSIAKDKFQKITLIIVIAALFTYIVSYVSDDRLRNNINNNIIQQIYDTGALFNKHEIDQNTTGVQRLDLWEKTIDYICEKPIIGHGADVTGERLEEESCSDRCHCEFLNYAVSFGVPALILYIIGIFLIYLRGLKYKKQLTDVHLIGLCTAFAYLASSFVGNSMFFTAPYLFIMLGVGYVRQNENILED